MAADPTSFEVYVLQRGRWELHAHHPPDGRDAAVQEAKTLEKLANISQVKVICDVLDDKTGTSSEFDIYVSDERKIGRAKIRRSGGEVPSWIDDDESGSGGVSRAKSKSRKQRSGTVVFIKFLLLALGSFIIASLITWIAVIALQQVPSLQRSLGTDTVSASLFGVFILTFIISTALSIKAFISREDLQTTTVARKRKARARHKKPAALKAAEIPDIEEELQRRAQEAAQKLLEEEEAAKYLAEELAAEEEEPEEEPEEEQDESLSEAGEDQKIALMNFLRGSLETVAKGRPQLDKFNIFGVNLYLAGACETMAHAQGLAPKEFERILRDSVTLLGVKPGVAKTFAASYDSYLIDPKYLGMIEAGRNAMQEFLANVDSAVAQLSPALDTWNQPKGADETTGGIIAVMFTDIVGSTQMTQDHGDAAAQKVVRTHNRIVRAALTTYQGREVKHTGDGIMAAFNTTFNSVEAAIYIQRQVAASNATNPALPLGLKIGINAGEPIVEDDDLFGSTVQLSARIVDKAKTFQVMVSDTVRGLCQGKPIQFASRGSREMKGFADPVPLYEALWRQEDEMEEDGTAAAPRTGTG